MAQVNDQAARRAWRAYAKAAFDLKGAVPTDTELKGMRAALQALADHDAESASHRSVGTGTLTVLVFQGSKLWALGKNLIAEEAQVFCQRLWEAPVSPESPPETKQ